MYLKYLNDKRLYSFLDYVDKDMAHKVKKARCFICGSPIHVANYHRKPRGKPSHNNETYWMRYSFCCSRDGCRKRATPPSVRFLGRNVYLGVVVFLITACCQGATPLGLKHLKKTLDVDRKTLKRWRTWWEEIFPKSDFWQQAKRQLFPRLDPALSVPESLIKVFDVESSLENLAKLLRFLAPVTTPLWVSEHASLWPS